MFACDPKVMPVHQINVNPPDWQPSQSQASANGANSPANEEQPPPEWTPRVIILLTSMNTHQNNVHFFGYYPLVY